MVVAQLNGGPGGGLPPNGASEETSGEGHKVTAAESAQGYCIYEIKTGLTKLIQIQTLAARNKTTTQKRITLGYKSLSKGYIPISHGQQANDVDAWVCSSGRPVVNASAVYMRIEDPATNDVLILSFSLTEASIKSKDGSG